MDITLHGFSVHPFQADLSRRIAADSHVLRHVRQAEIVRRSRPFTEETSNHDDIAARFRVLLVDTQASARA